MGSTPVELWLDEEDVVREERGGGGGGVSIEELEGDDVTGGSTWIGVISSG